MLKKSKGDHTILAAMILLVVAVTVGIGVMSFIRNVGPANADTMTNRVSQTMHSDGNRVTGF